MVNDILSDLQFFKVPIVIQEIRFESNNNIFLSEKLRFKLKSTCDSETFGDILVNSKKAIRILKSFDSFKHIKVTLDESNLQISNDKIPIIVKFLMESKKYGIKTGIDVIKNEPAFFFKGDIFNIFGKVNRISISSHQGIQNSNPFELTYNFFLGSLEASIRSTLNCIDKYDLFIKKSTI